MNDAWVVWRRRAFILFGFGFGFVPWLLVDRLARSVQVLVLVSALGDSCLELVRVIESEPKHLDQH